RILEIGCGTGKATLALAGRGFRVTCVELGERLAEVARRNLRGFPDVEVVNADFEAWEAPVTEVDAVVAFTSFHWIDPEVRYERSAALLRDGGALAVVATKHVLPPDGDPFFAKDDDRRPPQPEDVADLSDEILASGLFVDVAVRRHLWDVVYTADEYVAVLDTYSEQRALEQTARDERYARIRRRSESTHG